MPQEESTLTSVPSSAAALLIEEGGVVDTGTDIGAYLAVGITEVVLRHQGRRQVLDLATSPRPAVDTEWEKGVAANNSTPQLSVIR